MTNINLSGCSNLDLSLGSQFGDCSLAVNLASPGRNRETDFDDELEYIEENKDIKERITKLRKSVPLTEV